MPKSNNMKKTVPKSSPKPKESDGRYHTLAELIELKPPNHFLAIDIREGKDGTFRWELVRGDGETLIMGGPGKQNPITALALRFHEFTKLPIYFEGNRLKEGT